MKEGRNKSNGICYFEYFLCCKLIKFSGEAASPTKYSGILMLVLGIFLIGGIFKSPELKAFPKPELLKTMLSFSHPWVPTSISVKQQFASATPNKFNE